MYNDFFGFRERPFSVTPDPRVYYTTPSYQRIYNSLVHSIREGTSLSVMTGEVGTGKTTMLRRIMRDLSRTVRFAYLTYTTLPFDDLLIFLCDDLEIPRPQGGQLQTLRTLQEVLTTRQNEGQATALLIDEAQNLQESVLEDIRHLLNLATESKTLLPVVLVGQPELERKLALPSVSQLTQRVAVHCQLDRLKERDIAPFIAHRLRAVGYERDDLFTPEAIERITFYAQGIPRLINIICDNALLLGYSISEKTISAELIEEVSQDLGLHKAITPMPEHPPAQLEAASTWAAPVTVQPQEEQPQPFPTTIDQRFSASSTWKPASAKFRFPQRFLTRRLAWAGAGLAFVLLSFAYREALFSSDEDLEDFAPSFSSGRQNNKPPDLSDAAMSVLVRNELSSLMARQRGITPSTPRQDATPIKPKEETAQRKAESPSPITVKATNTSPVPLGAQEEPMPLVEDSDKQVQQVEEQMSADRTNNRPLMREPMLIEAASQGDIEKGERLLREGGIIPDMVDDRGWTALMMAALRGHHSMVQLMLTYGADVNMRNSTGGTALMMAAIQGRNDILQLLLDNGAQVNIQDAKGWTALMYAARNGHTPTVQILLSSGAEINLKNTEGQTALAYATAKGHQETARVLQDGRAGAGVPN
jgi:general secretion pathway protein A